MTSSRLEELKKFLEQDPGDPFTHYAIALEYAARQDFLNAVGALEALIVLDQNYVPAYQQLGSILTRTAQKDKALKILERGIQVAALVGDKHAQQEMQEAIDELEMK